MPYRRPMAPRHAFRNRSNRKRVVVSTIQNTLLAAIGAGGVLDVDLLTGVEFNTDQGYKVLRCIGKLTPNAAPALNDNHVIGLIVGRNSDVGLNIGGQVQPSQANLPWHMMNGFVFNGGYTVGGGNVIPFRSARSRRIVRGNDEAYLLSISSATAVTFRLFARTWVELP